MSISSVAKQMMIETFKMAGFEMFLFRKNHHNDYTVVNRNYLKRYYVDNHFQDLYTEAMIKTNSTSRDSFPKQCRYYGLYQMVRRMLDTNVPGDFAECGCWRGHSSYIIGKMIGDTNQEREFHVFDSFEGGLSNKSEKDMRLLATTDDENVKKEKDSFHSTVEEVSRALSAFDFVKLYKGWIPERFSDVKGKTFALINLDLDLYQPIRDSLDFFFPRLSDGGVIIVDDYGTTHWPGATKAVNQFLDQNPVTFSLETLGSIVILK